MVIAARKNGYEIGALNNNLDFEVGEKNNFEIDVKKWNEELYSFGNRIYIPDTEFGGIIDSLKSSTGKEGIKVGGTTWRGLLGLSVVEPPEGESHLILSGELNEVIGELIQGSNLSSLFSVSGRSEITVSNWKVDRYVTLLDAIEKLVSNFNYKLKITYDGSVVLSAVPVEDRTEEIEISQEGIDTDLSVEDFKGGINHLICLGEGENQERIVLHLFVNDIGSVVKTQTYTGIDEKSAVYNYSSADLANLEEDGIKKLKELKNSKKAKLRILKGDLEIGDIVSGYDQITGTSVKKKITRKILKVDNGKTTVEYKTEGE